MVYFGRPMRRVTVVKFTGYEGMDECFSGLGGDVHSGSSNVPEMIKRKLADVTGLHQEAW